MTLRRAAALGSAAALIVLAVLWWQPGAPVDARGPATGRMQHTAVSAWAQRIPAALRPYASSLPAELRSATRTTRWRIGCHPLRPTCPYYGLYDFGKDTIWIAPKMLRKASLRAKLRDVITHEAAHAWQRRHPAEAARLAVAAGNRERAADCIARAAGARWTWYTACRSDGLRRMARGTVGLNG